MNTDKETPPCDCIEKCGKFWVQRCDCHNGTSLAEAEAWCRDANRADELQAMREAIKEAFEALQQVSQCRVYYEDSMDIDNHTSDACATALTKLKPFVSLKP